MTDFGHGMKALSELRVIQNEIGVMCFSRFEDSKKMPWGAALHIQAKLETWYRGLPTKLQPRWSEALISTLILCFNGLYEQSKGAYFAIVMLALMRKQLSAEIRNTVGRYVTIEEPDSDTESIDETNYEYLQPVLSELVLPGTSLSEDPKTGRIKHLMDDSGKILA